LTIVLLADRKDHGPNEHDYPRWQTRWSLLLGGAQASDEPAANLFGPDRVDARVRQGAEHTRVARAWQWPDAAQWRAADLVVAYCYLAWTPGRVAEVRQYLRRGGGLVLVHSATWTKPAPSPEVAALVGVGGFQRWRHGLIELEMSSPTHPIGAGLPPTWRLDDEPNWPPTPPADAARVHTIAGSKEAVGPGETATPQPLFWTFTLDQGRVFGCVPGHYSATFDDPYFRLLLLRGMAWAAGESPYRFDDLALRAADVAAP